MDYGKIKRKDLLKVPFRKDFKKDVICDSLIIIPTRRVHDSGYMCMDFIAIKDGKPLCRLSGVSDVLHIEGISGFGMRRDTARPPQSMWSIDCLPNGLLRLFVHGHKIVCKGAYSNFEVLSC